MQKAKIAAWSFVGVLAFAAIALLLGGQRFAFSAGGTAIASTKQIPAEMAGPLNGTSYFPYFSTYSGSTTKYQVLNAGTQAANVTIQYLNPGGGQVKMAMYNVPPQQRSSINAANDVGTGFEGSAVVQVQGTTPGVAVEQSLMRGNGAYGNTSFGIRQPGTNWGLLNGRTGDSERTSFATYIKIQNPGTTAAQCQVTYFYLNEPPTQQTVTVPPGNLKTLPGSEYPGMNKSYGASVVSDQPVTAAVYQTSYSYPYTSGNVQRLLMNPGTMWYSSGGSPLLDGTSTSYQVVNPNQSSANVTFAFQSQQGSAGTAQKQVPARSYQTYSQADLGKPSGNFSAVVTSDQPVYVGQVNIWGGGQKSSIPSLSKDAYTHWLLAEGRTGNGFDTFLQVQNPNTQQANVNIKFIGDSGAPVTSDVQVSANSQKVINASDYIPQGTFGVQFTSPVPIVVGRNMYWNNQQAGDSTCGYGYDDTPVLTVSPPVIIYYARAGSTALMTQYYVGITLTPTTFLSWYASSNVPWLNCQSSGSGSSSIGANVDATGLRRGTYEGTITVSAPGAIGTPKTVNVKLVIF